MSQVRSRDGTTIGYDRLGAGPPVILVDGAFCSRAFGPMPKLAPRLARDFTVFVYDRRGRGASGDTAPYARRLAEAIPGAQLRGLPSQTHNVAATALAPVLKEFFAP